MTVESSNWMLILMLMPPAPILFPKDPPEDDESVEDELETIKREQLDMDLRVRRLEAQLLLISRRLGLPDPSKETRVE